jgi:hypothetical protein
MLLLVAWDLVLGSWFFIGAFSTYFWHLSQNMRQDVVYSQLYMWKHVGVHFWPPFIYKKIFILMAQWIKLIGDLLEIIQNIFRNIFLISFPQIKKSPLKK